MLHIHLGLKPWSLFHENIMCASHSYSLALIVHDAIRYTRPIAFVRMWAPRTRYVFTHAFSASPVDDPLLMPICKPFAFYYS